MFSFPHETVLDPFMGSGTTASVAKALGRNSVGYEINNNFIPLIRERLSKYNLLDTVQIKELRQNSAIDIEAEISKLPYRFVDVHKTDKKIDVKKLQFGSKIDAKSTSKREDYFSVKEILSPELIVLNNGLVIKLIGIKANPLLNGTALEYLRNKLHGKKVFLRFDEQKYDKDNHLLAYLYLENKTFINAHMIKDKMALVDDTLEFKYKNKFISL